MIARRAGLGQNFRSRGRGCDRFGVFPDIRSFSDERLTAFLASLEEEAAGGVLDPTLVSGSDVSLPQDPVVICARTVPINKIEIVRAELSARGGEAEPD